MSKQEAAPLLKNVEDSRVREAFLKVDRSRFVPEDLKSQAWADHPLPIEDEATISQPSLVAQMTELLRLRPEHRVLEIGTGSGYQTALLAELADEVYTIEISDILSQGAQKRLAELGYTNIKFRLGDGALGWPEAAPFDAIIATAAFSGNPDALLGQLAHGGIAIVPVGAPGETQTLTRYQKTGDGLDEKPLTPVRFISMRKN